VVAGLAVIGWLLGVSGGHTATSLMAGRLRQTLAVPRARRPAPALAILRSPVATPRPVLESRATQSAA
jgi:hypothetical protein